MDMMIFAANPTVIQIGATESLLGIAALLVGIGIAWGTLITSVKHIKNNLEKNIEPDLKNVRERLFLLEGKTSKSLQNASPIRLTPTGEKFLDGSGLKNYIDANEENLTTACHKDSDTNNPYDVQQSVFEFFATHHFPDDVYDRLKTYAYSAGISIDLLRRIGAVYFRDKCLEKLGFTPEQIDGHDPNNGK